MTYNQSYDLNSQYHFPIQKKYPKVVFILFSLFALYLVLPIVDVPLIGLSLSAPLFFFIATYAVIKPPQPWFHEYRKWIILAVFIWIGVFVSAVGNGLLSGGVKIEREGFLTVIRYAYWLLVFVVTVYFASQGDNIQKISSLIGWGVLALALLRWAEVIVYENIGAWTGTRLLFQNTYGFLFSTFSPFLLVLLLRTRGPKMVLSMVGNILLWGAAAINGSRGSWVSMGIGMIAFLFILAWSRPKTFAWVFVLLFLIGGISGAVMAMVPEFSMAIASRYNTFQTLDTDKSYMIRRLMNQKSLLLFEGSPVFGVGAARFRLSSVPLEIPAALGYASQEHFNVKSSHNSYLSFLAENGLLGAIPFGILLFILAIQGYQSARKYARGGQYWALAIYLSFIQMSAHMWGVSSLTNTSNWFIYGLVGAVIMAGIPSQKVKA